MKREHGANCCKDPAQTKRAKARNARQKAHGRTGDQSKHGAPAPAAMHQIRPQDQENHQANSTTDAITSQKTTKTEGHDTAKAELSPEVMVDLHRERTLGEQPERPISQTPPLHNPKPCSPHHEKTNRQLKQRMRANQAANEHRGKHTREKIPDDNDNHRAISTTTVATMQTPTTTEGHDIAKAELSPEEMVGPQWMLTPEGKLEEITTSKSPDLRQRARQPDSREAPLSPNAKEQIHVDHANNEEQRKAKHQNNYTNNENHNATLTTNATMLMNPTPTKGHDLAQAELSPKVKVDLKEEQTQGEERQWKDLLLLLPAHVQGPCCYHLGEKGRGNKETTGTAKRQPERAGGIAVKGKHGRGTRKESKVDEEEKTKKDKIKVHAACAKASLSMELASFRAIVRHIIKNNAKPEHQAFFKQHTGCPKWLLKEFAVVGQQPTISATKMCTSQEVEKIRTAIMLQCTGGAKNQTKDIRQAIKDSGETGNVYRTNLKWAKIDVRSTIRWMRTTCPPATERQSTRRKEVPRYQSRMVECGVCMHQKETKHMQLKIHQGYRSITCPKCHSHARVGRAHMWHNMSPMHATQNWPDGAQVDQAANSHPCRGKGSRKKA